MPARLNIRVQPGASRNRVVGEMQGAWKITVTGPPVEGRANRAVVELLAGLFGVAKPAVTIVRGASSRSKTVEIEGIGMQDAQAALEAAAKQT